MALKILNENFFDDIKDSDIEKDSESQLQPDKNSKKSYQNLIFTVSNSVTIYPQKILGMGFIDFKKLWMLIDETLQTMRFYETNKDTEIYVVTEKDRNAYDYSVLSRNMVPPENTYFNDYRSMSSKTIYEKVFENIDRFVTGYNPNWKEDDSKDNYYIVLTTVFNIYGTWEKIDYDMFYSDMSRFISVMTKYKMFMEHISTMFDSTNDCQIVLRKCGEGDYTYVHGGYRHLPMSSWTNKTISIIYTEIFNYGEDMTFTDEQSSSDIHINPTTNMKDVYKIWHKIYFYPDSQEDYLYRPIGYNDLSEHNPKIWCFLYRNDDSKWTYEQINEWFKKHFIDKMNHNNKLNTIGKWDRCNIELFICVNKDTPPRNDKKKSYVYEYEDKMNDYQTLMWRFIYYNEQFVRIGRTSRAYIPKNADDAYDGKDQYVKDIKEGYFGDPGPIMERFTEDGVFSYNKPNKFDKKQ